VSSLAIAFCLEPDFSMQEIYQGAANRHSYMRTPYYVQEKPGFKQRKAKTEDKQ